MNKHSRINWRFVAATLCGIGLAAGVGAFRAQADQWDKKTILTVNQPVQIEEYLLQPGTYVMKLLDSQSNRNIVEIFNGDQKHLIGTVMAINNYRLQPTGNSRFMFWETPPGTARAMRAWFYPGDNFGQEFRYPKHLNVVETAQTTTSSTQTEAAAPPPPETPAPQPTVAQEPQASREEQVEIAQNNPPPAPAPEAQPAPAPEQLPKTASLYPLIGLSGLFSLAIYGLLRRRSA
jgi:outer membrane biosynthesis protein TonB